MNITVPPSPTSLIRFDEALDSARAYARDEKAPRTRDAYRAAFGHFVDWTQGHAPVLPASVDTVAAYLASMADRGRRPSTIDQAAAAIAYAHRAAGHEPPTHSEAVKAVLRGIRRRLGTKPRRKAPATSQALTKMLRRIPATLQGKRDRALLLIGFAAALRRSELVALNVEDLEATAEGIFVHIRKSKTDQEGEGHSVAVPRGAKLKPVEALADWLDAAGIESGPVFVSIGKGSRLSRERLSDRSVADIVKARAKAARLDPTLFAGHSLRSGFVSSALESGADLLKIMSVTRHTQVDTLRVYDRRAQAFKDHAGKGFL